MVIIRAQEPKACLMGDNTPLRVDPVQLGSIRTEHAALQIDQAACAIADISSLAARSLLIDHDHQGWPDPPEDP
jgi:hypothetical protein